MQVFLCPNPEPPFNLRVFYPAYDDPARPTNLTDDEFLEYAIARNKASGVVADDCPVYRIASEELPSDHYFFNAWEWVDGAVVEARAKCEAIHMDRIRVTRDKELVALDVPYMRALEAGDVDEQTRITGLKQTLRDIPQTFDLSGYASVADLKAAWPDVLPRPL